MERLGGAGRDAVVRRIDAVFAACACARSPGTEATQAELSGMLLRLLTQPGGDTDAAAAAHLAERLAEASWAPHAAAAWLARTGIAVARPLIARSPVLTDADLLALVVDGTGEHRLEVARRPALSPRLAHGLISHADPLAIVVLLHNATARIDGDDLDELIGRARSEPALRAPLARRPELESAQAARLAAIIGAALRRRLQARFASPDASLLEQGVAATSSGSATFADGDALVDKLADAGRLLPATLLVLLRRDGGVGFEAALARLSGASREAIREAMLAPKERLPRLLVAAGLDPAAGPAVIALATRGGPP